jgi:hypothetical protein
MTDTGLIILNGSITATKGFQGVSVYGTVGQRFAPSLDPGAMNFASAATTEVVRTTNADHSHPISVSDLPRGFSDSASVRLRDDLRKQRDGTRTGGLNHQRLRISC